MLDETIAPIEEGSSGGRRRGQLHSAAVETLRSMIVSGRIPPGAPLREKDLCAELGISRTPLREAIRTLASEGLVRLSPNRSAVVTDIDVEETRGLFEMIGHLEALGGRLACERATEEEVREVHAMHYKMLSYYYENDFTNYLDLNRRIHRTLVTVARNTSLLELWEILAPQVERARSMTKLYPERWKEAMSEHQSMVDALSARDGAALSRIMSQHYLNGLAVFNTPPAPEPGAV